MRGPRSIVICLPVIAALLLAANSAAALAALPRAMPALPTQEIPGAVPAPPVVPVQAAPQMAPQRSTPQRTMRTFLAAMNDVADGQLDRMEEAVACLDLSDVSEIIRDDRGPELAIDLIEVIDKLEKVYLDGIPNKPDGEPYEFHSRTEGRIVIARTASGEWLFTSGTIAALPELLLAVEYFGRVAGKAIEHPFLSSKWLRERVPESLRETGFLLEHWQWLGLFVLTFLGVLLDRFVTLLLALLTRAALRREHLIVRGTTLRTSLRPFGLLAMALAWQWGLKRLSLPDESYVFLKVAAEFVVALAGVWGAYRLVDILGEALGHWAEGTESTLDDLLVPLLVKSLKVFVVVMGIVFLAHQLRFNILGLATGLGLGGLAFALASQDLLKNLFGSVMVIADRTFQVGDWVIVGDVEGTVERVGFRSTRVRTFYNSLITLPNSSLITASVDNLGNRRYRRWKAMLSLTYDTPPEKIEAFCEGVRELVRQHPYTRKDYYQVYLNAFAPTSLDVLVYVFFECPDWSTELRERQRLMLDVLRLARRMAVEFAFPTQTLHVRQGSGEPQVPADYGSQRDVSQATLRSRKEARDITSAFGLDGDRPPPVRIGVPEETSRGEGDG
jgi:MscS family membrane protein